MDYYLIANNHKINIDSINPKKEDIIILYNSQLPLKYTKILNHKNKILFIRKKEVGFFNESTVNTNSGYYSDIFLINEYPLSDELIEEYNKKYNYTFNTYVNSKEDIDKYLTFDKKQVATTGFISFCYILNELTFDNIYLVGFTGAGYNTIWHSGSSEQKFYRDYIRSNNNLHLIN